METEAEGGEAGGGGPNSTSGQGTGTGAGAAAEGGPARKRQRRLSPPEPLALPTKDGSEERGGPDAPPEQGPPTDSLTPPPEPPESPPKPKGFTKRGFTNLGATCYASTGMTALLNLPWLSLEWALCTPSIMEALNELDAPLPPSVNTLKELVEVLQEAQSDPDWSGISLSKLCQSMGFDNKDAEQDVAEFLLGLCNQTPALGEVESLKGMECPFHRALRHEVRETHTCYGCHRKTERRLEDIVHVATFYNDPNPNIFPKLDSPVGRRTKKMRAWCAPEYTLGQMMQHWGATEKIKARCGKCGHEDRMAKRTLATLPRVLCVQFSRRLAFGKLLDEVDLPLVLDLKQCCTRNAKPPCPVEGQGFKNSSNPMEYHLASVVHHSGGSHGGHYKSYVRRPSDPERPFSMGEDWFVYDDRGVGDCTYQEMWKNCLSNSAVAFYVSAAVVDGVTPSGENP